jgi:hypothetical protein
MTVNPKEAAMTDGRGGNARRYVGLVTTAVVSLGAAAAVGWAAAVPVVGSGQAASTPTPPAASARTAQQVDAARSNLQQVRRDLARILSREDDLPRANLPNLPALVTQLPTVQVPQASSTQPAVAQAAPPVTQTTTGASGAHP